MAKRERKEELGSFHILQENWHQYISFFGEVEATDDTPYHGIYYLIDDRLDKKEFDEVLSYCRLDLLEKCMRYIAKHKFEGIEYFEFIEKQKRVNDCGILRPGSIGIKFATKIPMNERKYPFEVYPVERVVHYD